MIVMKATQMIENWAVKHPWMFHLLSKCYHSVIGNEVRLAKIKDHHKVLFIGGGACPCSAIAVHKLSSAMVTVIDNNERCVQVARKLAKNLALDENRFHIIQAEGEEINASGYDVIHIALQITPKEKVLQQVQKSMDPHAKVLLRMPKEGIKHMYDCKNRVCFKTEQVSHSKLTNIQSTVLLDSVVS